MQVIVKTCSGISLVPLESRLLSERKIFIQGEITEETACSFEQKIIYLLTEDPDKRIDVYIDSPGGSVSAGLHIYDTIKSLHTETNMWCRGTAASMGAIILAGGQKGRRFILPHAKVMIHEPLVSGGVGGCAASIQRTAESIMETKRLTIELLAADTGKRKTEIEKAISFDNYMNAREAVRFGICDKVVSGVM